MAYDTAWAGVGLQCMAVANIVRHGKALRRQHEQQEREA
jgi:hypothetical protein